MATSRITEDDVNKFFLDEEGNVWRLIAYAREPTATFERVDGPWHWMPAQKERRSGVVGSLNLQGFVKLVPETGS